MGYSVSGTTITLTRGDSFSAVIGITNPDGSGYVRDAGDSVRFAMKKTYEDDEPLLVRDIASGILYIYPEDTTNLDFGVYVYDVQLTKESGEIDTFIKGKLKLTEEVC